MIEVGEYVINQNRLVIGQIIEINEEREEATIKVKRLELLIGFWNIKKYSKNIIDLIEVGDFINGEKVEKVFNPFFLAWGELPYVRTANEKYEAQEIETILTKEQYMQNCYKTDIN